MSPPKYLDKANRLIAAFPVDIRTVFLDRCELVSFQRQDVLTQAGQYVEHVHFPIDSFAASIFNLGDGQSLQVGVVGNEGMTSPAVALGTKVASLTNVVQGAGRMFRLSCRDLQELVQSNKLSSDVLHKYISLNMDQLARNMACASSHTVEQRLVRWLLVAKDCTHSSELVLTHEVLASMLGVRRERITPIASLLQKNGLIHYNRGSVTLVDEPALQALACRCYQTNKAAYLDDQVQAEPELFVF